MVYHSLMRLQVRVPASIAFFAIAKLAWSQGQIIDQGSFTITHNGQRAGREDFTIAGTPAANPQELIAKATVVYGDRRLIPELRADSQLTPYTYSVEVKNAGASQEKWRGSILRGRVSAKIENSRGEAAKEFIASEGALILDDDVYHQYYFVARKVTNGTVAVIIPRRNSQQMLKVSSAGADRVTIGTQEIEARHLVLTDESGEQRDLWVDSKARVLKVSIPSKGIVALRDDPPG
jgi:hypothetical protein